MNAERRALFGAQTALSIGNRWIGALHYGSNSSVFQICAAKSHAPRRPGPLLNSVTVEANDFFVAVLPFGVSLRDTAGATALAPDPYCAANSRRNVGAVIAMIELQMAAPRG